MKGLSVFLILFLLPFCTAINVSACNDSITSAGSTYTLINNLNSTGTCLNLQASDIVLDCNGYSITSNGGYDIISGSTSTIFQNQTIKNCVLYGTHGIVFQNCYCYGCMGCGSAGNIRIQNVSMNVSGNGFDGYYMSLMEMSNTSISAGNIGIHDFGAYAANLYTDSNISGTVAFMNDYSGGMTLRNCRLTSLSGTAIYNSNAGAGTYVNDSIINASQGSYTFSGATSVFNRSSLYVNTTGMTASWAAAGYLDYSQVIARDNGIALSCVGVPVGCWHADHSNITSEQNYAIRNGGQIYPPGCDGAGDTGGSVFKVNLNHSYVYSSNATAGIFLCSHPSTERISIQDTVFESGRINGTALELFDYAGISALNLTLISNRTDLAIQGYSNDILSNISFNSTGHMTTADIWNVSNAMNFTSGSVPFNFTGDAHLYVNVSSPAPFYAHLRMHYGNVSPLNESLLIMAGYDGYTLTNVSDSYLNMTNKTVQGTVSFSGIFGLFTNGTMLNYSGGNTTECEYYNNCTIGMICTDDTDCLSGICYMGRCIANGGCVGASCHAVPDTLEAITRMLEDANILKLIIALIILSIGAYAGFQIGGQLGAILLDMMLLVLMSFLPISLIPWWMTLLAIISGGIMAFLMMRSNNIGGV